MKRLKIFWQYVWQTPVVILFMITSALLFGKDSASNMLNSEITRLKNRCDELLTEQAEGGANDMAKNTMTGVVGGGMSNVAEAWNKRETGWMPIETAPRDGTRILVTDNTGWCDVVEWCLNDDEGWVVAYEYYVQPTHWRPLPPEPTP